MRLNLNFFGSFMSFLGLCPLRTKLLTWVYTLALLLTFTYLFWYEIHGRIQSKFGAAIEFNTRGKIVGVLNTTVNLLCSIVITLPALFSSEKIEVEIKSELRDLDIILSKYVLEVRNRSNKSLLLYLIILNIFYVALILNDASLLFATEGSTNYQYYVFDLLFRYRITICALYIYDFIKSCLYRIITTNNLLEGALKRTHNENLMEGQNTLNNLGELVADVSLLHAKFSSMIRSVNAIFGWPMLFIFFNYIFLFITTYEMGLRSISANLARGMNWQYSFWAVFSMAYSVVAAVLLTSICHRLTVETNKLGDMCYFYLYDLKLSKNKEGQKVLVKLLVALMRQSRNNSSIMFSAAGFFPINYSTLFILVNLLMSHLLALIQF